MSVPKLALKVGGEYLQSRVAWGDLTSSWSWPGGCKESAFTVTAKYGSRLPTVVRGALVEVLWGGWPIWTGSLQEPDWNGSEARLTAAGLSRDGERYVAFDGSYNTTDVPSTAVDQAIARGLRWTRHSSVPTAALAAGSTDPVNTLSALLDAAAEAANQRWAVDAFRSAFFAADPTTPTLHVTPGPGDLGIADDNYASNVVLRYYSSTTSAYKSAVYPAFGSANTYETKYGHAEFVRDVTDRGPISDADAATLAQAVYDRSKKRPGWTNGLELAHGEVLNEGGKPVHPLRVAAEGWGKVCRLHGVRDEVALTDYTDFVIGETSYTEGAEVVSINPVGLVSRDQESVLTELLEGLGDAA